MFAWLQLFVSVDRVVRTERLTENTVVRMEITAVAEAISGLLTPFMSLLTRMGTVAMYHATEEAGAKGWTLAKDVWARLRHRVADDPALKEATDNLTARQDEPGAQEAFRRHLERVLANDPSLLRELDHLLTASAVSQQVNMASEVNIGVQAGSIHGGTVMGIGKQLDRDP